MNKIKKIYNIIKQEYGEDLARIVSDSIDMRDTLLAANTPDTFKWEVPHEIFKELNHNFKFTLDVCADSTNKKCERYFSKEDNGLSQDWSKDICWMCPPYGEGLERWVTKAYIESLYGAIVVGIIPARPDLPYWKKHIENKTQIKYFTGRVVINKEEFTFPLAIIVWCGLSQFPSQHLTFQKV